MGQRKPRYPTKGQVYIAEVSNTEALLKNLSSTGICIESTGFMEVVPKTHYSLDIIPEKESKLEKFSMEIESRWIKAKMKSSESGFAIIIPPGSPGKAVFEQYLAFLSSQSELESEDLDTAKKTE